MKIIAGDEELPAQVTNLPFVQRQLVQTKFQQRINADRLVGTTCADRVAKRASRVG